MNKGRQKDKTCMPFLSSCFGVLLVLCWRNMLPNLQPLVSVQKCCFGLMHTFVALCLMPLLLQMHLQNWRQTHCQANIGRHKN